MITGHGRHWTEDPPTKPCVLCRGLGCEECGWLGYYEFDDDDEDGDEPED